jgi:hypothetical protein
LRCVVEIEIKVDFLFVSMENEWSGTLGLTGERERERTEEREGLNGSRQIENRRVTRLMVS